MTKPGLHIEKMRAADLDDVLGLLEQNHLPLDGLRDHLATTLVARDEGRVVGSAALEVYSDGGVLRSVAVAADARRCGVGRQLTDAAIARACSLELPALYL